MVIEHNFQLPSYNIALVTEALLLWKNGGRVVRDLIMCFVLCYSPSGFRQTLDKTTSMGSMIIVIMICTINAEERDPCALEDRLS